MIGVSRIIGQSTETPMPSPFNSRDKLSASATTPNLATQYGPRSGVADHARERRREHDVAIPALFDHPRQERLDAVDRRPTGRRRSPSASRRG